MDSLDEADKFWRVKEFNIVHIVRLFQLTLSQRIHSGTGIYKQRCATNSSSVTLALLLASNTGIMLAPRKHSTWVEVDIGVLRDGFSQLALHF